MTNACSQGVDTGFVALGYGRAALAGLNELWELRGAHLGAQGWSILGIGLVIASISAFVAIWTRMQVLERVSAQPFVIHRALLGTVFPGAVLLGAVLLGAVLLGAVLLGAVLLGAVLLGGLAIGQLR